MSADSINDENVRDEGVDDVKERSSVPVDKSEVRRRLRSCAFRITDDLGGVKVQTITRITSRLLRRLARSVGGVEAHLYQTRLDADASGPVAVKYRSERRQSTAQLGIAERFQFRLLPPSVQDALKQEQNVHLKGDGGAGRVLSEVMRKLDCDQYILCPLFIGDELRGMLGVAIGHQAPELDPECIEMLQMNGAILLNHVVRLRLERYRRSVLKRWRRIADQACDFAFSVKSDMIATATSAFGHGERTPQLDGLRLTDIVVRSFHQEVKSQIENALRTSTVRTCDFQMALGHEGPHWYMARIEPTSDPASGEPVATLYLTDNNPDKILEEEIRELRDHLVRASRLSLLGQMSTEFSHQLKQPLQAILTYCNTLQRRFERRGEEDDRTFDLLDKIEASVLHSAEIIQSIRDFVKHRTLRREEVALEEVLDQAMMMVQPTARGWNADLIAPADVPETTVVVDSVQTVHVLVNLMVNALEACHHFSVGRPRVELYVRENPDSASVTLAVKDNGPGLPEENPEIVFEKFHTGKSEGLGLGLAISRDVCESQGGSLSARNNEKSPGCTFFVRLPLIYDSGSDTAEIPVLVERDLPIE